VNISGGGLASVNVSGEATLNISGGFVDWNIDVADFSILTMTGGGIGNLHVYDTAVVNLHGGHISSGTISAGRPGDFGGVINFYGYDLATTDLDGRVRIHGFYHDGSPCDINVEEGLSGRVNLIPEPATIWLLGLGGLVLRTRKQRV
jgi:hypothetical protein